MEHASFPLTDFKFLNEAAGVVEGLAAGYGNADADGDVFQPGAFTKSLQAMKAGGRQPAMLLHHDPQRPAGRWESLTEGPRGLQVKGALALEASDGREAYALLKAGALTGLSVGFRAKQERPRSSLGREILEAELFEISLVSTPCNPITRIHGVKAVTQVRELEELLREAGFSSRRAKAAASAAWRAAQPNEQPSISPALIERMTASIGKLQTLHTKGNQQ